MKIIYTGGEGEIVEKKSRFIATLRPVQTEAEAIAFIGEMKKKYWDARHNCSAFVIGKNQEISRCSDDGEPSQTAGRPMLDVLLKEEIHNAAVVVTRYFGGVLLGTGGLVRAYQKAVQAGLNGSVILDIQPGQKLAVHTDYNGLGKIQYLLGKAKISIIEVEYTDQVIIHAMIPLELKEQIRKKITEGTNGTAMFEWQESVNFAVLEGEVITI
ncbi:MAG: YigZ family protein [Lachnospiraceae bacterium]|nr:YigZ family protein [Lachnospiraceae bacterium]MDE6980974.1 YigZ family protein [Lachnospiraceae bacterium]